MPGPGVSSSESESLREGELQTTQGEGERARSDSLIGQKDSVRKGRRGERLGNGVLKGAKLWQWLV